MPMVNIPHFPKATQPNFEEKFRIFSPRRNLLLLYPAPHRDPFLSTRSTLLFLPFNNSNIIATTAQLATGTYLLITVANHGG